MDRTSRHVAMSTPTALIGVATLFCLMSAAVLGSLLQARIPGVRHWCAAVGLLGAAAAMLLLRRSDSVVAGASVLLVSASLVALHGFRRFFHLRASVNWEYGVFGLLLAGLVYWTWLSPDVDARGALVSGFLAYVRLAIAWLAQRHRPAGRPRYSYDFVSVVAALGALVHAVRCAAYGFGFVHETAFLMPTPLNLAFLVIATLTLPCLSVGVVMLAHDRLMERMERLATVDDLTGLLGRRAFIARGEALLESARAAQSQLSIVILDIDDFKRINDCHGHAAGDQTLAHVALTIARETRHADVLGRIGGEEFALLLPRTGREEAERLTNRLRAIVAASVASAPAGDVTCTFSAGVAEIGAGDTLAEAMARADTALYAAKASGRNCVVLAEVPPVRQDPPLDGGIWQQV
ncbi:diguanylate cyclase [Burkholderia plantarii]|uniref:diguanylate cyclase n=2 Tax=Burkholderia plantarii TaxID=41899 RepID=A0A0B6S506_BURPL|nr:diguanylate cyclase [Burkholderia plantarii]